MLLASFPGCRSNGLATSAAVLLPSAYKLSLTNTVLFITYTRHFSFYCMILHMIADNLIADIYSNVGM